jgi:hypothetical protein
VKKNDIGKAVAIRVRPKMTRSASSGPVPNNAARPDAASDHELPLFVGPHALRANRSNERDCHPFRDPDPQNKQE